jgi:hypothetical protein
LAECVSDKNYTLAATRERNDPRHVGSKCGPAMAAIFGLPEKILICIDSTSAFVTEDDSFAIQEHDQKYQWQHEDWPAGPDHKCTEKQASNSHEVGIYPSF